MPMPDEIVRRAQALEEPDEHESSKPVAPNHQDDMPELQEHLL